MDTRALTARLVLAASVVAGVSYMASWDLGLPPLANIVWKGAGVALLAVYAAISARSLDGWLICAVMALGALGDVLLETHGLVTGAFAFLAGHVAAIGLYLRHRRAPLSAAHGIAAVALVPVVVAVAYALPADRALAAGVALYSGGLAAMAAAALVSRFPLALTGLGALMFVVSDLLIFAREGALAGAAWVGFGVWSLYYAGQLLICLGVTRTLAARRTP